MDEGEKLLSSLINISINLSAPLPRTRSWACPQNTELGKQIGALDKRLCVRLNNLKINFS